MNGGAIARGSAVVFVAAMLQTVIVSAIVIGGGAPDLLLVVVISLGLLRGSIPGAVYGFAGGLVVDLLTLDTLGFTSLVLTLAGFWAGRYAETSGRGQRFGPLIAVGALTVLAGALRVRAALHAGRRRRRLLRARYLARTDSAPEPRSRRARVRARPGDRPRAGDDRAHAGGRARCLSRAAAARTTSAARPRGGSSRPIPACGSRTG